MQNQVVSSTCRLGDLWHQASLLIGRLEARFLLQKATGCRHTDLIAYPEREIINSQAQAFEALVQRRKAGEPLAYLLEEAEFYGREFIVSPAVLIPREDTQVLVDQAANWIKKKGEKKIRVLELGTGSGIVAITLALLFPDIEVTATDISLDALNIAQKNALKHKVTIRYFSGSWFEPVTGEVFDLIVSNPPYVAENDPHLFRDGLPFEPQIALTDGVSGGGGLACIKAIIANAHAFLRPGGALMIEHGYDQAEAARSLLQIAGYENVASWKDNANIERVSSGNRPDLSAL